MLTCPTRHSESVGDLLAGADIRNRAGARKRIGCLNIKPKRLGGFIQRCAALHQLSQFVCFRTGQSDGLLVLIIGKNAIMNLGESTLMRRKVIFHSENNVTTVNVHRLADLACIQLEKSLMHIGRVPSAPTGSVIAAGGVSPRSRLNFLARSSSDCRFDWRTADAI